MGIETITLERFACDRCDLVEKIPCGTGIEQRSRWGHVSAQRYQGAQLFEQNYKITLCPNCCDALRAWGNAGTSLR